MKILVVSDTHGDTEKLKALIGKTSDIDALIHAGDYETDTAEIKHLYPSLPVYGVCGNCDTGRTEPPTRLVEIAGKRIFITHGHRYDVNFSLMRLTYTAMENNADIAVFGHTHIPVLTKDRGLYIVNPGSLSRPRGRSKAGYAVINISDNGEIDIQLVEEAVS
jgi:hypothetical protein